MSYSLQVEALSYKENGERLVEDFDADLVRDPSDERRPTRSSRSLAQMMGGGVVPPAPRRPPSGGDA